MNRKIIVNYFGAVVVALLMVCSACAINVIQLKEIKNSLGMNDYKTKDEVIVDQNIYLTKEKLPLLKIAVKHITDPEYELFVNELIKTIEKNGKATSDDLKQIVSQNNLNIDRISTGLIIATGFDDSSNKLLWFPGYLRIRHIINALIMSSYLGMGPILVGTWSLHDGYYPASYRINIREEKITPNKGMVLLGLSGYLVYGFGYGLNVNPTYKLYRAGGIYSLILVTEL